MDVRAARAAARRAVARRLPGRRVRAATSPSGSSPDQRKRSPKGRRSRHEAGRAQTVQRRAGDLRRAGAAGARRTGPGTGSAGRHRQPVAPQVRLVDARTRRRRQRHDRKRYRSMEGKPLPVVGPQPQRIHEAVGLGLRGVSHRRRSERRRRPFLPPRPGVHALRVLRCREAAAPRDRFAIHGSQTGRDQGAVAGVARRLRDRARRVVEHVVSGAAGHTRRAEARRFEPRFEDGGERVQGVPQETVI